MATLIIGIDLGTTTTVVSRLNEAGRPEIVMNWENQPYTHSALHFTKDSPKQPIIGSTAREVAGVEEGAFKEYKRDMGTERVYHAHGEEYTPTALSALMLRKQREHIENTFGQKVDMVVITTPANFPSEARAATVAAAVSAGFPEPITTMDEPTAAALYYADSEPVPLNGYYLIYDFGGGTLDVTVLQAKGKDIQVKYSMGVAQLGGKDFDERLRGLVAAKFKEKTGSVLDVTDTTFNDFEAEKVKHRLTDSEKADFKVRSMQHGLVSLSVSRAEFEEEVSALITQAEFCLEGALDKAGIKFADLKGVYMAGGTSKIPCVQKSVERLTSIKPKVRNPEQSISLGSALYAAVRLGTRRPAALSSAQRENVDEITVKDVAPYYIGTLTANTRRGGEVVICNSILIPKGESLPAKVTKRYYVRKDGTKTLNVDVTSSYHETEERDEVTMLADTEMDLGPDAKQGDPIEVTFVVNENGQFEGEFKDVKTGKVEVIKLLLSPDIGTPPDIDDFLV
jgi:molecular chaperone DnaK